MKNNIKQQKQANGEFAPKIALQGGGNDLSLCPPTPKRKKRKQWALRRDLWGDNRAVRVKKAKPAARVDYLAGEEALRGGLLVPADTPAVNGEIFGDDDEGHVSRETSAEAAAKMEQLERQIAECEEPNNWGSLYVGEE